MPDNVAKGRLGADDVNREFADLIVSGGTILTQDPSQPKAQALAVKGERILAVGAAGDIAALRGPQTRSIDLAGRTVLPGIIDAHAHMEREGLKGQRLSLQGLRSIGDILDVIRAAAARGQPGEWIVTMPAGDPPYYFGGPAVLAERRMPTRHELDGAAPDNPVYIAGSFNNWVSRQAIPRSTVLRCAKTASRPRRCRIAPASKSTRMPTASRPASSWRPMTGRRSNSICCRLSRDSDGSSAGTPFGPR
jgi:predicted amidohydrolase YtcJ